ARSILLERRFQLSKRRNFAAARNKRNGWHVWWQCGSNYYRRFQHHGSGFCGQSVVVQSGHDRRPLNRSLFGQRSIKLRGKISGIRIEEFKPPVCPRRRTGQRLPESGREIRCRLDGVSAAGGALKLQQCAAVAELQSADSWRSSETKNRTGAHV